MYFRILSKRNLIKNRAILFEVTKKCNLKCTYCIYEDFYNRTKNNKETILDFKRASDLIDYMINIWNSDKNSSFNEDIWIGFYGGEPLLNFKLINKIVKYLKSVKLRFNKFRFNMTTNGTLLHKYMDFLVENNFDIMISLDGDKRNDSYRKFKNGKNSFDIVIKNVKELKNKYPEFFRENVNFNAVLHNKNSVEEIYRFIKNEFEKYPRISELNKTGVKDCKTDYFNSIYNRMGDSLELSPNKSRLEKEILYYSPRGNRLIKHLYFNSEFFTKSISQLEGPSTNNFPTGSCVPLQRKIFLDVDGNIFPCERVGKEHKMGKVTEKGVEIWFDKIAEKYNFYFEKLKDQCNTCYNKNTCPNCILKMELEKDGYKCKYWLGKDQYKKRLEEIMDFLRDNRDLYREIAEEIFLG